ncbi:MAG: hypothetical protein LBT10_00130, partial [Methanobrevibacter sp.]|nr:hypothetical protein [Methanobrevibacter sp.]
GTHHINEQWPEYWIKIFKENGFEVVDYIRWEIWNNPNVELWYKQNIFLFVKKENLKEIFKKLPEKRNQYSIIHPELYNWLNKVNKMLEKNMRNILIENDNLIKTVKKLEELKLDDDTQIEDEIKRKTNS